MTSTCAFEEENNIVTISPELILTLHTMIQTAQFGDLIHELSAIQRIESQQVGCNSKEASPSTCAL